VNVLSLYSGIEGLGLGLQRAGFIIVGQVEWDPFCMSVLEENYPEVPKHGDVRTAPAWWRSAVRPRVDVVSSGFPCQPFSPFGLRLGIDDERWGWPATVAVIDAVRPRFVLLENVVDLRRDTRAFRIILGDLHARGFDAQWSDLPACAVGAPHTRERVFILAYPAGGDGEQPVHLPTSVEGGCAGVGAAGGDARGDWWLSEPRVGRVAHGLPKRLVAPHLHALGNAVVPTVGELVGRRLMAMEAVAA
jgi:DNA (cytosine-5)-methyltransferase 1